MKNKLSIIIFTLFLMLSFGSVEKIFAYNQTQSNSCLINSKLPKEFSGGFIIGTIDESIKDLSGKGIKSKAMPNIQIKAQQMDGKQSEFYGTSNDKGYYEIKVPVGKYLVTLTDSNFYYGEPLDNKAIELSDKDCEVKDFYVVNDSRIEGKVIDSFGNPVTDITIDIIPVGKNRGGEDFGYELSQTFSKGNFTFTGLSPGFYQISLNYTDKPDEDTPYPTFFYPYTKNRNEAQIIEINYGTKLKNLIFQLPPKLQKRKITGQVFQQNGKPAKNVGVKLVDIEFEKDLFFSIDEITNVKGEFEMNGLEGRKYKVYAIDWENSQNGNEAIATADAESKVFTLDENTSKFEMVLKKIDKKIYH